MLYKYTPDANNFAGITIPEINIPRLSAFEPWAALMASTPLGISPLHYVDQPVLQQWSSPVVEVFEDNPPKEGDFPSLSDFWRIPVFSDRAWEALNSLISDCCEPLPIIYPSGRKYSLIHVLKTIDCLDIDKSKVGRRKIDQGISAVYEYAFKPNTVEGHHIFKLPPETGGDLIVDDDFRNAAEKNKLKGLLFRPLKMTSN